MTEIAIRIPEVAPSIPNHSGGVGNGAKIHIKPARRQDEARPMIRLTAREAIESAKLTFALLLSMPAEMASPTGPGSAKFNTNAELNIAVINKGEAEA